MPVVNMLDAKSKLSRLVQAVESGEEKEIVIARNGKPAARLVPIEKAPDVSKRIGIAKGLYDIPDEFDELDAEIEKLFHGEDEA